MKPYYDDGQCVIYHGDCREILPLLRGDLVLTDPPYGVGMQYASYVDTRESWRTLIDAVIPMARSAAPMTIMPVGDVETHADVDKHFTRPHGTPSGRAGR